MGGLFGGTRLAPSPTGALHLGHARTFLVTWWMARQAGAKVFMRMEDLDAGRAKAQSVKQAYEDLRWLGMDWDAADMGEDGIQQEVLQSGRMSVYRGMLRGLWERGLIYPCGCTRAEIAASVAGAASAPHAGEAQLRYPGTCAGRNWAGVRTMEEAEAAVRAERGGRGERGNVCWRFRVAAGGAGRVEFEDWIAGRQAFDVAGEVGDFPVTRFDGTPAYQLACVADDHAMGIDLVVRGDDLLSSTPRQIGLYRAMGWEPPGFAHVPLVIGADGRRLAKRHGESRIAEFRAAGVRAERIVGWAAWRCGQMETLREISAREMVGRFDLGRLPRERVVIGEADLAWLV